MFAGFLVVRFKVASLLPLLIILEIFYLKNNA